MEHFDDWCRAVLQQVRFWPDCDAIRKELTNHYEDHVKDLQRIGYDEALAKTRALAAMGDAEEVGRGLDKAHKPWLGWLWVWSKVALFVVVSFMVLCVFYYSIPQLRSWFDPAPYFEHMEDAVPLSSPLAFEDGVFRYEFDWAEYTYFPDTFGGFTRLQIVATASSTHFWLDGPDLYDDVTAVDSEGRTYRNDYSRLDCTVQAFAHSGHFRYAVGFILDVWGELPEWIDITNTTAGWTFRLYIPQGGRSL